MDEYDDDVIKRKNKGFGTVIFLYIGQKVTTTKGTLKALLDLT